jgi:hypothetical protein
MLKDVKVTTDNTAIPAVVVAKAKDRKEPWCIATSRSDLTASQVVKLYARRFRIEETFRDTKDIHFGMGLSATHIGSPVRRDRLLFLAAFAFVLLTLLGEAGERAGLDRYLKANTSKKRTMSLYNQGFYWFMAIPNMKEERLERLVTAYAEVLQEHRLTREILGIIGGDGSALRPVTTKLISIVTPCFNEEYNIRTLHQRTVETLESLGPTYRWERIFIDNASTDRTVKSPERTVHYRPSHQSHRQYTQFPYHPLPPARLVPSSRRRHRLPMRRPSSPPELIADFIRERDNGYRIVAAVKKGSKEAPLMYAIQKLCLTSCTGFVVAMLSALAGFGYLIYKLIDWDSFRGGMAPVVIGLIFFSSVQIVILDLLGTFHTGRRNHKITEEQAITKSLDSQGYTSSPALPHARAPDPQLGST